MEEPSHSSQPSAASREGDTWVRLARPAAERRAATGAPSVAFVTVSYGPDRDRCGLLCRSMDALAPATSDHVIIVDRADLPQFRELESGHRRIVATEDVLPNRVWRLEARRVGLRSNVFLHLGKPIRGWLVQQLVKLAACREVAADIDRPRRLRCRARATVRRRVGRRRQGPCPPVSRAGPDRRAPARTRALAPHRRAAARARPQPDPTARLHHESRSVAARECRRLARLPGRPLPTLLDARGLECMGLLRVRPLRSIRVGRPRRGRPPSSPARRPSAATTGDRSR